MKVSRPYRRYLWIATIAAVAACAGAYALNLAVDPLWYGAGNKITGRNFAFNERFAKLNRLMRDIARYDCLIFGSSRTTLLDETRIEGHTCANLAFSAGVISEFVEVARYVKAQGASPKLVIVGVDAFNFWRDMSLDVPAFVTRGAPPPGRLPTYLSFSAVGFSIQTLLGVSPLDRSYDQNFIGRVARNAPTYRPPALDDLEAKPWGFDISRLPHYFELRAVFPNARYIGYVPPVSAWQVVEELYLPGHIEHYLQALETLSGQFDAMYDFSIPSEVTMIPENTYDGDHYSADVNAAIADSLQGRSDGFGFALHETSHKTYVETYTAATVDFLDRLRRNSPPGTQ